MIKVTIPHNFIPEKEYIIQVILSEFLGLEYSLEIGGSDNYTFTLQNGNRLIIQDTFFKSFTDDEGYLKKGNIPDKASFVKSGFSHEEDLPVIFGDGKFEIGQDQIICGVDIIASSFFMLSRWEEYCIKERNLHGNFPTELSYLHKNNLKYRPVVNEYVELLWNMLVHLGLKEDRKTKEYQPKITHDIDNFARYDSFKKYLKAMAGDFILRKKPGLSLKTTSDFLKIRSGKMKDPYDTFDFLMDVSDEHGLESHFYFIPGIIPEEDVRYNITDKRVAKTIKKIIDRGHVVGLHGTYSGFKNAAQFKNELQRLQEIHPDINEGRQHYLRFSNPETWQIWEDNNLKNDSSIGYEYDCGFRAGVCYEYPVFNILSRKKLKLIEQPLVFMEGALRDKYPDKTEFMNKLTDLVETVRKYNGLFVFLWHNSNINTYEWKYLGNEYVKIVKSII